MCLQNLSSSDFLLNQAKILPYFPQHPLPPYDPHLPKPSTGPRPLPRSVASWASWPSESSQRRGPKEAPKKREAPPRRNSAAGWFVGSTVFWSVK